MKGKMFFLWMVALLCFFVTAQDQVNWPKDWKVFGPVSDTVSMDTLTPFMEAKCIPEEIEIMEEVIPAAKMKQSDYVFDFARLFYPNHKSFRSKWVGSGALIYSEITVEQDAEFEIGAGADWWMCWYVDGKMVYSTMLEGNYYPNYSYLNHRFKIQLKKGKHTICALAKSGSYSWVLHACGGKDLFDNEKKESERLASSKIKVKNKKDAYSEFLARYEKNRTMRLVVYGSSVAKGAGAKDFNGWAAHLGRVLKKRGGWKYINESVSGDTTKKVIARFEDDLLAAKPDVVVLGLSLANEGIRGHDPAAIYQQFRRNMHRLIQMCRKHNIAIVVTNCYPNGRYTPEQYAYIRNFNAELALWNVPSIDFMGAVGDADGHWEEGTMNDPGHPCLLGHQEMFYAIPPSLFDFMIDQPSPDQPLRKGWLSCRANEADYALSYQPKDIIHSFSACFDVKLDELPAAESVICTFGHCSVRLNEQGELFLIDAKNQKHSFNVSILEKQPVSIGFTWSYLRKKAAIYLNGKMVRSVPLTMNPDRFSLGGKEKASFRNYKLYRSCLRADQMEEIAQGTLLKSSLELYAPLSDGQPDTRVWLRNLAPTEAAFQRCSNQLTFIAE